ncbi:disease resistance protein RUN1-like [Syzygium oleosum]|uniref:disease resistance protein RUN1-like n=1 Tax=Syzygium oleosum TaxID=219896 RepID=UPI0024BA7258|nr:disease resistance protein RUN1-like [Syzygium oleosum]
MDAGQSQRKRTEKESTKGASAPSFIFSIPSEVGSDQYDVFLSFRGSDTRKGFTDHLYHSLVNAGIVRISVFRDESSIPVGEEFGSQIIDAITRSKISIPIISENYASSKWCLCELIHIMDCKKRMSHIVLPIFYKVAPSDVRHLQGNFGKAFHSRQERFDKKDIEEGQRALKEVSDLNGWESEKIANGHEGELINLVVETVLSKLRKDFQLDVPKQLVGLDGHLKEIMNWINNPSVNARMIGIYGMGGIGKTTLAKCIYNQLSNKFVHSFLPDVRETTRRHGIKCLQSQLILDILKRNSQVSRVDDGINIIKSEFKRKKVLILLDDIDHKDQLDALARERNWFTTGSLIIVTTRYRAVLDQSEFEVDYMYELNEMDGVHSLLLFNKHAFRMDHSSKDFERISRDIISTMGGLPLALKIIGSYLYRKTNLKVWQDMLKQLKNQPHRDVQGILKISFDALERGHQEIFLDIACFFIGEECKFAMYMWEECGFYASQGIEELKLRCLIKIGDDGKLRMHDQLRDLGRNIVCQEGPLERRSRLWDNNEAFAILMGGKGTESVQAIRLDGCYDYSHKLKTDTSEHFKKLRSLRFLCLGKVTLSGDFNELFSELRWLQLSTIELFSATNLHLPNLVVLRLTSNLLIAEDWRGWSSIMMAERLKVLNLHGCLNLRCTPDLSAFIKLEILILTYCSKLKQVHPSIGKVKSLVSLNLGNCYNLEELPEEVGELEELKELNVGCTCITKIPMSIGSLRKLEKLIAFNCSSPREISNSIGSLSSLQHLDLNYCDTLREIPSSIRNLSSLQHLDLSCCKSLREISSSIGNLSSLQHLDLSWCKSLREISNSIGSLSSLQHLNLNHCESLREIPSSIGNLSSLQHLDLPYCKSLREIPSSIGNLSSLQYLDLSHCESLREIPSSIGDLQNLQHLDISYSAIEKLPSEIGDLFSLKIFKISGTSISNLPESIQNIFSLQQHLELNDCKELWLLPELPFVTHLFVKYPNPKILQTIY